MLRSSPATLLQGAFSAKLRIYIFASVALWLIASIIGIVLLPVWLVAGPFWAKRYHAALRCDLTERSVIVARGLIFRRELTIPFDKIQDISIREGPLLSAFGLLRLRIETAGQSNSATGKSDADLIGLIDARMVRDRIIAQRDMLASTDTAQPAPNQVLTEIRDILLRLEQRLDENQH